MSNEITSFTLPKIGEEEQTIQDRFASNLDGSLVAIADGAGSSLYPSKWADILVTTFCQSSGDPIEKMKKSHEEWLKPLQEEWRQYYLAQVSDPNRKWWQGGSQIKDHGSATFIGLSLQHFKNLEEGRWQAAAIGDSCLFKLDNKTKRLQTFPIQSSQEFKSTTKCFRSLSEYPSFSPRFEEGEFEKGDIFLLATDAVAQGILVDYENKGQDWREFFVLQEKENFAKLIMRLRDRNLIKNDDTTIVLIRILDLVSLKPLVQSGNGNVASYKAPSLEQTLTID
jgi:serine/threonine protein phosphatase PrpC